MPFKFFLLFFSFYLINYLFSLQTFEAQIGSAPGTEVERPIWPWNIVFFIFFKRNIKV